ncbi:MAG: beta-CASP ribonuclease aCPSF1 [Candidatus Thermoplasmatota archaeon]
MTVEDVLREFKAKIRSSIPVSTDVSQVEFEGALLVIYTKTPDKFAKNKDLVKNLAKTLQKRIVVRPDPSVLTDEEIAEKKIREIIPKDAEITDIFFQRELGEVTIEALKPGAAIGKEGQLLNEIKKSINWTPRIIRAPPIQSKTVKEIRGYLRTMSDERRDILQKIGRKLHRGVSEGEKFVRITALGGFREVGRSCSLLSTQDSRVLIDCGVDVSSDGAGSPYIHLPEVLPLEKLDAVVITHAHLDHCGLVPLLYKYGYAGPIYCTPPTRDLMTLLQMDYLKVAAADGKKVPYSSEHIRSVIKHCIPIGYGDTTDITPDIRLTFHNAGHILGSSICHFHIGEGLYNIAFSGDIKFEKTWLFNPAVNHFPRLEALVVESTYGGREDFQPSRREATDRLKDIIVTSIKKKGKVLVPVFAVGRSQEVMIVLESLVKNKDIPPISVYLDGMIWEATAIHTAYPEYLNNRLRTQIFQQGDNPLLSEIFKRVDSVETRDEILADKEPCVVLATSGMMNGGPVMEYFKSWSPDEKNTLVFVGYQAEGTLGRKIQRGAKEIALNTGGTIVNHPINMNVETCDGFSGHSDRRQLVGFISNMSPRPERVIFSHGEESKCIDISSAIHKKMNLNTAAPYNLETIRFK